MQWKNGKKAEKYDIKRVKSFAFFPVETDDNTYTVWWEHYYRVYRYINDSFNGWKWHLIDKERIKSK